MRIRLDWKKALALGAMYALVCLVYHTKQPYLIVVGFGLSILVCNLWNKKLVGDMFKAFVKKIDHSNR